MNKSIKTLTALLLCLLLAGCGAVPEEPSIEFTAPVTTPAPAQPTQTPAAPSPTVVAQATLANIHGFTGVVEVKTGDQVINAYEGMRLFEEDTLRTGADSTATLDLDHGRLLMMDANTELRLTRSANDQLEITLLRGAILNDIAEDQPGEYTVRTANVTMGVLGTIFYVAIDDATGVSISDLFLGGMSLTFTTSSGQEHSFTLVPGRRFAGSQENIDSSAEHNELVTGEICLDDLSPAMLAMLREALAKRKGNAHADALLEEIAALEQEREEVAQSDSEPARTHRPVTTPEPIPVVTPEPTPTPESIPAYVPPAPSRKPPEITRFDLTHTGSGTLTNAKDSLPLRIHVGINDYDGVGLSTYFTYSKTPGGISMPLSVNEITPGVYDLVTSFDNGDNITVWLHVGYSFQGVPGRRQIDKRMDIELGGLTDVNYTSPYNGSTLMHDITFSARFRVTSNLMAGGLLSTAVPTVTLQGGGSDIPVPTTTSYNASTGEIPVFTAQEATAYLRYTMTYEYPYAYRVSGGAAVLGTQSVTYTGP